MKQQDIQIYTGKNGEIDVSVNFTEDSVWLNLNQIAEMFGKDKSTISRHIRNIFTSEELLPERTVAKNATVQKEGEKLVERNIEYYNLDMIISIGYRVNSQEATHFRIWATRVLKQYLVEGYTLNEKRLAQKENGYLELQKAMSLVQKAITTGDIESGEALGLLDVITGYTKSWLLLQKYDEDVFPEIGQGRPLHYKLEAEEAYKAIIELKKSLMIKHEATELFAHLREVDGLDSIFGNVYQTFDEQDVYPNLESKAAHLLYFIIKDHPFTDGNKRSAAFIFILFLAKNKILFDEKHKRKINDRALVAITLLIAQSHPKDKETMIQVVMNLIA